LPTATREPVSRRREDGRVEIPRWRHAVINFPHPLLQQGLVILDTPGLNAIGTEPELTLSLLPNAHAVLFILAADTGVTQSDLTVWREHIGNGRWPQQGSHRRAQQDRQPVGRTQVGEEIDAEICQAGRYLRLDAGSAGRPDLPGFGPEGAGCQDQRRCRTAETQPPVGT
jgi:hypothetical protein